jgi:hypothetical protein
MTTTIALPVAVPAQPTAAKDPQRHRTAMALHMKHAAMLNGWAARAANSGMATAMLFAKGPDGDTWRELLDMQHAILEQLQQQTRDWQHGLVAWGQEWTELKAANTASKLVEQELNLFAQFGELVNQQTTAFVGLMESVQVGYGFWVSQKLGR